MKRALFMVMIGAIIASMTIIGCAAPTEGPPTEGPPTEGPPTEGPPPTGEPLVWGMTAPLTGYDAEEGQEVVGGVRMALDEVDWIVAGRPVELVIEDDAWDPAIATSKTKKLILDDKVDMLVGPYHSLGILGAKDLIIDNNILAMCAWGLTPPLFKDEQYFKNHFITGYEQGEQMARFMAAAAYDKGWRKCIIFENDFEAGRDNAARFKDIFEQLGGEVIQEIYTPFGTLDFSPYFLTADIDKADFIFNFYWGGAAVAWFTQYIDGGLQERIPFWTWGILDDDSLDSIEEAGYGQYALGIQHGLMYIRALDIPSNIAFKDRMMAMYGRSYADFGFINGYDAGKLAIIAIEGVNGDTDDLDGMIEILETTDYMSPRGLVHFGPYHVLTQDGYVLEVVEEGGDYFNILVDTYPAISMEWLPEQLR